MPLDWKADADGMADLTNINRDLEEFGDAQKRLDDAENEILKLMRGRGCAELLVAYSKAGDIQRRLMRERMEGERRRMFGEPPAKKSGSTP